MNRLDVYLHDAKAGTLERLAQGRLRFAYEPGWTGLPVSLSLPLRQEPFEDDEAKPFFAGLLPEGDFLRAVARSFGISATNPFSLLEAIGGECAGAVSLVPEGARPPRGLSPKWLDSAGLARLIDELPQRPLLGGEEGLRLSLAGAQDKLPVVFGGGRIGITRGDPASTHIIKLPPDRLDDVTANETFCLALARHAELDAVDAEAWTTSPGGFLDDEPDDSLYLLVPRYDRTIGNGTARIHQEDLCQGLGYVPELKYEADGGPGVAECARHIREHCAAPAVDILAFADALLFNLLIGNNDAHSKNYSLILEGDRAPRLAPLYDLVSTEVYEGLSRKMAMKLGGEYRARYVRGRHLGRLASDMEMSASALRDRAVALAGRVEGAFSPARDDVPAEVSKRPVLGRIEGQVRNAVDRLRKTCAEI
jgi:serine/threonine-protein kinase HipA